jgi:DNA (cytosine-5)-methyltransferase 1
MRPRLLDLFCGAGGCTKGYQRAGFYVVGVDIDPMPNYCGDEFFQADALDFPLDGFDAIHASPPCQDYSRAMRHLAAPKPRLIDAVRELLIGAGVPWVIENVVGAPLPAQSDLFGRHGVELCGSMFGLRVQRHRLFECSFPIEAPEGCSHGTAMNPQNGQGRTLIEAEFGEGMTHLPWMKEMGVGWMTRAEARQAIPPAFTAFIGAALMREISAVGVSGYGGERP